MEQTNPDKGFLTRLNIFHLTNPELKILLSVLSILLVLCTMAYISHYKGQQLISTTEKIERSEEIKYRTEEILSIATDMETGARGFALTGDENYLVPSNKAIAAIFVHLDHLKLLLAQTPEQQKNIARLENALDEKISVTNKLIAARRQSGLNGAIDVTEKGREKALMDAIRTQTLAMLTEEDARLNKLKEENKSVVYHFTTAFYILLFKIAITVVGVILLLIFYFSNRKKSDKLIKENHELLQSILDHTSSIISIKDISGKYMMVNKMYEKLYDRSRKEVEGKSDYYFLPKEAADVIRKTELEVVRQQKQMKFEETIPARGQYGHYVSLKFPLFDNNNIPYAICSISTDETEKIKNEKQFKEQMSRVLDLFNKAPCGYQSSNSDGIIIEINDTELNWLGYTRNEVIGKMSVRDILTAESQELFKYYFPRLRSGEIKEIFDVEATYKRKDGSKFPIIANTIAHYDEHGNFAYTRTSIFDLSYRKHVEALLAHN